MTTVILVTGLCGTVQCLHAFYIKTTLWFVFLSDWHRSDKSMQVAGGSKPGMGWGSNILTLVKPLPRMQVLTDHAEF